MSSSSLLTVTYTGEPERIYSFPEDRSVLRFGRDDQCDIVIWSAINGRELSRVAGCIWRMDDELWIRNLSNRHELQLQAPYQPLEPPLPPRRDDGMDRGPARSLPAGLVFVRAPGGCELLIRQVWEADQQVTTSAAELEGTRRAPEMPANLKTVAAALCEPLLAGGQLPASYAEIHQRARTGSLKRTRTLVARLCALYADEIPSLRQRVAERLEREADQLGVATDPRLKDGIWTFEMNQNDSTEAARRRALVLPDYYEVAHLLVRRKIVTRHDVDVLGTPALDPGRC